MTWDPHQYLKFEDERTRPALELISRIPGVEPVTVWDLGCGTGAITRMLAARWPHAQVWGLDSSPEMLAAARASDGEVTWVEGDIATWSPPEPVGLVFANASLHWVADHGRLFPALATALAPGGVLAVQMPRNFNEPTHTVLARVALRNRWAPRVGHRAGWRPVDEPAVYFDRLATVCATVDIWETSYLHVLRGEDAAANWVKGTAARPYLEDLGADAEEFFDEYAAELRAHYPPRPDGATVMPFRRLFVIATR